MSQVTENKVISAPVPMTPLQEFWHYFKRNKGAVVGLVYVVIVLFIAIFANWIAPYNPAEQFRDALLAPPAWQEGGSMAHLLGTDDVGRGAVAPDVRCAPVAAGWLSGSCVIADYGRYSRPDRRLLWRPGR